MIYYNSWLRISDLAQFVHHEMANPLRYSAFLVLLHVDKEHCCFNVKTTTINFISTALHISAHNSQNICCTNTKQRILTVHKQVSPLVYSLF